jgi:cytoskeletal protein CcmA (bactofilin family)
VFGRKESASINVDKIDTVIGRETEIKGTVNANGIIRIDGKIEGHLVNQGDVVVGEGAFILADVKARHVTVAGEIKGNVTAEGKLEILSTGKVHGNIQVQNLVIGEGAVFKGKSEMSDANDTNPLRSQEAPKEIL